MTINLDKEIIEMYIETKSLTKVSKHFKRSPATVKRILRNNNVALIPPPLTVRQINELLEKNNITVSEIEKQYSNKSSKELRLWLSDKVDYSISQSMIERLLKFLSINKPFQSLTTVVDERSQILLNEWDYTKNNCDISDVSIGSSKDFWWICSLGHNFEANVYDRYSLGYDCSVCAGKIVVAGFNDLLSNNPVVASEWNYKKNDDLSPDMVTTVSGKKVWWVCSKDNTHEWEAKISARTNKTTSTGCPYCTNQRVVVGKNDLQTNFPKIAEEWDYEKNNELKSNQVFSNSNKEIWWIGKDCGHSWKSRISDRMLNSYGCPYCSGKRVLKGFNDLRTTHVDLVKEWDNELNNESFEECSSGSHKKVFWKCFENHSWSASIKDRVRGNNCPVCSGRKLVVGVNDLATVNPDLALEWDYDKNGDLTPQNVTAGADRKIWWKCEKEHSWISGLTSRNYYQTSCPMCSHSGVSKMEQDFGKYLKKIYSGNIIQSDRTILMPKELDFYLPALNMAFEFNGLYWHSEASGKDKNYHYDKWKKCHDKDIQLITIWEDDWNLNRSVVEKVLAYKLGASEAEKIGARKTYVDSDVPFKDVEELLNNNHIQGSISGSDYIGLRSKVDDSLVAVIVLRRSFKATGELDVEIVRYATSQSVQGGFTKLLKHVAKEFDPVTVSTFSDNEISDGGLYERHGFEKVYELKPDYKYIHNGERKHKFLFRKDRFRVNPDLLFEDGLTESELADLNGLYRVYDSGKTKWVLTEK